MRRRGGSCEKFTHRMMVRWWVFLEKIVNFFHKCKFFPIHILWIFTLNYGFLIDKSCSYVLIFMILVNCMDKNSNFIQKIPIFHKALKICCREMEYILKNCRELKIFLKFCRKRMNFCKKFPEKIYKKGGNGRNSCDKIFKTAWSL